MTDKLPSLGDMIFKLGSQQVRDKQKKTPNKLQLDSFEWIEIPSGYTSVNGDKYSYIPPGIETRLFIDAFFIAKYPVTNSQYAPYVWATGHVPPYWNHPKFNHPQQAVVGVSWFDVIDYCAWLSGEVNYEILLPTDHQWQRAAQGRDGRKYPWGNEWDIDRLNANETIKRPTLVDAYPGGASPYGVMDMSGNVWEWAFVDPATEQYINVPSVLCGGSWLNYSVFATVHARNIRLPNMRYSDAGFRLSRMP